MRSTAAARRYAAALFQLARDDHKIPEVAAELEGLRKLFADNAELASALLTPLRPVAERKKVLSSLCDQTGTSTLLKNFYSLLIDRRRLVAFDAICDEYQRLSDEASGLVTAQVVSASELDDRRKDRLRRALSERTGFEVKLEVEVDPSLIAGAIASVGGQVFDGSLRTQLSGLRANLTKGS